MEFEVGQRVIIVSSGQEGIIEDNADGDFLVCVIGAGMCRWLSERYIMSCEEGDDD